MVDRLQNPSGGLISTRTNLLERVAVPLLVVLHYHFVIQNLRYSLLKHLQSVDDKLLLVASEQILVQSALVIVVRYEDKGFAAEDCLLTELLQDSSCDTEVEDCCQRCLFGMGERVCSLTLKLVD